MPGMRESVLYIGGMPQVLEVYICGTYREDVLLQPCVCEGSDGGKREMLVSAKCVYIASRVDERDGKKYASCNLENNDSVVQVSVSERLVTRLPELKKYMEYECVFEYDRVNSRSEEHTSELQSQR